MTPSAPAEDPAEISREEREEVRTKSLKLIDAKITSLQSMHEHLYDVAAASPERAVHAADTVQKASAAIAALYTGVLALIFSVSGTRLPLRGITAPLFLGLAVVLSTAYLAYIKPEIESRRAYPALARGGAFEPLAYARLSTFIEIMTSMVERRSWMLRGAVVSLGVGLAAIALPFLSGPAPAISAETEKQIESVHPWPSPIPEATSPNEVNMYKSQLDEAAAVRAKARVNPPGTADIVSSADFFLWSIAAGVLIVGLGSGLPAVPAILRKRSSASNDSGNGQPGENPETEGNRAEATS